MDESGTDAVMEKMSGMEASAHTATVTNTKVVVYKRRFQVETEAMVAASERASGRLASISPTRAVVSLA